MKNLIFAFLFAMIVTGASGLVYAQQCDRTRLTPIKCGYYEEGYQDGAVDAKNNLGNDFKRYKSKIDNQYESFYRSGYDEGFASVRPYSRWTDSQKNTYDQGYDDGKNDRDRNISRLPARYEGQYDRIYEEYFRNGYLDGYDNRSKQYDTPIGVNNVPGTDPTFPRQTPVNRRGTATGTAIWMGRVDNRANIVIKGDQINMQLIAGPASTTNASLQGVLPRRVSTLTARAVDGRGTVTVIQQPNRNNDFTGIVQISDPRRGDDNYNVQISWTASAAQEAYSSGRVTWRGRVDGTVGIRVSGDNVESADESGSGMSQVSVDMTGYLASRPGTVRVNKKNGRGSVYVLEQPNAQNDYTAVIRVFDPDRSDDFYEIDIEW